MLRHGDKWKVPGDWHESWEEETFWRSRGGDVVPNGAPCTAPVVLLFLLSRQALWEGWL